MERRVLRGVSVNRLHRFRRARSAGFTLVELAIVVAIVGVLAVIALVGYRKYMQNAKVTEARQVIGSIRIAQEAIKSERGTYVKIAGWCPGAAGNGNTIVGWDSQCGTPRWQTLPVHVDGAVRFQYQTSAKEGVPSGAGEELITGVVDYSAVAAVTANATKPSYVVAARCDLDDNTTNGMTELVGTSYDNIIRSRNDGY